MSIKFFTTDTVVLMNKNQYLKRERMAVPDVNKK
jgi:hypothetical protein